MNDMIYFKRYGCERCNNRFRKIEELMQHVQIIHGKDLPYECVKCNVSVTGMEQMRDHIKKFHSYNKMKEDIRK